MRTDDRGRKVRVRGRQIHMTEIDTANFYSAVIESVPSVRFFDAYLIREGTIEELTNANLMEIAAREKVDMFFPEGDWQPSLEPIEPGNNWLGTRIADFPRLVADLRKSHIGWMFVPALGRKIGVSRSGTLNTNTLEADARGRKIIDKLFRLHRKLSDNRAVAVDLRTGKKLGTEKLHDWYGDDLARKCLTEEDLYLEVNLSPEENRFWGYLPEKQ